MCSDVGTKLQPRPDIGKLTEMKIDASMCGMCDLYGWHSMFGEWQVEEGWCQPKMREGNLSATAPKCDYFLPRRST